MSTDRCWLRDLKTGKERVLCDLNPTRLKDIQLGKCYDWNFKAERGDSIYGCYYLPPFFDETKQYPMLVYYYGGCSPVGRVLDSYYNNPQSSAFRTAMYKYHRQGLDLMAQDLENGYQGVLGSLDMLKNIYTKSTNMYCMILFGMTKCNEIVNMFLAASDEQRAHALDVMTIIDPSNTTKYDKLRK